MNQALRICDSSAFSEHWIRLNWLPGVMPRPSVLKAQFPVMTRCPSDPGLPDTKMDCGSGVGAARSSTPRSIQAAHSRASQWELSRLRKGRSASLPTKPGSSPLKPRTARQPWSFSRRSRSSAKAKSERTGEARSSDDGAVSDLRSSSNTRSFPVFRIIRIWSNPMGMDGLPAKHVQSPGCLEVKRVGRRSATRTLRSFQKAIGSTRRPPSSDRGRFGLKR